MCVTESYNEFQRVTDGVFSEDPIIFTIISDDFGLFAFFQRVLHFENTYENIFLQFIKQILLSKNEEHKYYVRVL